MVKSKQNKSDWQELKLMLIQALLVTAGIIGLVLLTVLFPILFIAWFFIGMYVEEKYKLLDGIINHGKSD